MDIPVVCTAVNDGSWASGEDVIDVVDLDSIAEEVIEEVSEVVDTTLGAD